MQKFYVVMSIDIEIGEDLAANEWVPGGYVMSLDEDLIEIISEMNSLVMKTLL